MAPASACGPAKALLAALICTACLAAETPPRVPTGMRDKLLFQEGARATLELDQPEYFLGENVLAHYCLENVGQEPFKIDMGGDYRGASRSLRFKVTATAEDGNLLDDPDLLGWCMGGISRSPEVKPGGKFYASLALTRYARFEKPGLYTLRAVHDLGWQLTGKQQLPAGEARIKFVMPTPEQAKQVLEQMRNLPKNDGGTAGQKRAPYRDFTCLCFPVYLPFLAEYAQRGDEDALTAIGSMPTPAATEALIGLLDHKDRAFVLKVAGTLNQRLPGPEFEGQKGPPSPFSKRRRWFAAKSWEPRFAPQVLAHARAMLTWDGPDPKSCAGVMLQALCDKDDLRCLIEALDWAVAETQNSLRKEHGYPEHPGACWELHRAATALVRRGAAVPTNPRSPGQAIVFLAALAARPDFRPEGWEVATAALLKHDIAYVRQFAVQSLPRPLSKTFVDLLPALLADSDTVVRIQACHAAAEVQDPRLKAPLLENVASATDEWLLRAAHDAAKRNGGRLESLEILARRFDDTPVGWTCFMQVMSAVIEEHGSGGQGCLDQETAPGLRVQWTKFIQAHREALQEGRRYKPGDPELPSDLMPPHYKVRTKDGKDWP